MAPPGSPKPKTPPPFPVLAPAQGAGTRPPVPIHIRAPESAGADEAMLPLGIPIGASSRTRKKKKLGLFVGVAALILVSLGGGFFAYQHFSEVPPPPPKAVVKPKATPSDTLNALASAPGKMIGDAQNAIADKRNSEQARIDAMANGTDGSGQRAARPPAAPALAKLPPPCPWRRASPPRLRSKPVPRPARFSARLWPMPR